MRRALLLCLGVFAVAWLEFAFFPGHTYREGDTQLYLPMLQRLNAPGFLSRDLVATQSTLAYTIYDELTLFLHEVARLDFHTALTAQQFLCRAGAIFGVFLLAVSTGVGDLLAFLIATIVNLGGFLAGPGVELVSSEPVPYGFAFALVLLACGLIAREKPLLAGVAGGVALVYSPAIAAPVWAIAIIAAVFDRRLRRLLRPALTILLVFVLLLANLVQLQPGAVGAQPVFSRISTPFAELQQFRTKYVWVSLWAGHELWNYLALWVCGLWAVTRILPALNRQVRWLFLALPLYGLLSVPLSDLLLEHLRWSMIPRIQPAQALLFTVAFASIACGIAGAAAVRAAKLWEACLWLVASFAIPMNVRILDLINIASAKNALQLVLAVLLAAATVALLAKFARAKKAAALLMPVLAIFAMPKIGRMDAPAPVAKKPVYDLADWAERETWGSSMFLFPDAGRALYPGVFRAASRRAVWVDWESGRLIAYSEPFAAEWWQRWQQTMEQPFSAARMESLLPLPIDYYVLKRSNRLAGMKPVFLSREFAVYDARDLRNARGPLRTAADSFTR